MKKLTFLLSAFFCWIQVGLSQSEHPRAKVVSDSFQLYYNAGHYEAIFNQFSPDMKAALPWEKTRSFLMGLKNQAGEIQDKQFYEYKESYACYKTKFAKALLSVQFSIDEQGLINGFFVAPFVEKSTSKSARNTTPMILPFREEWTVIWGGDTKEQNYHVEYKAQKHAFDLVVTDQQGKSFRSNGKSNEDYYAFGKELIAPCDAEVVMVVDGVNDNIPGEMNPVYVPGNTVVLKTAKNEYLFFAHFKQHSIVVKQGQLVRKGQVLGRCGNSGNSSEPHLHFHIQDQMSMTKGSGVKCYFESILVNGEQRNEYSPVQKERVKN